LGAIIQQLGLDQTFLAQFFIFASAFFFLGNFYFKPFMKLIEARHKRLVEDRAAAEDLVAQADAKFEEYKKRLADERAAARKEYEALLTQARREEAEILSAARDEARKITQEANESAVKQQEQLQKQLEADVEGLAKAVSETLLVRRS
jgi:F-type H+-transporting ATPase subunit b